MAAKSMKERLEQRLAENTTAHNRKQEELPDFLTTRKKPVSQVVTLVPTDAPPTVVRCALVDPNPWQPRTYFPDEEIGDLAASISEIGLIQPIVVRATPAGRYELVAGERRLRAHMMLGKEEIEARVVAAANDEMAVMALAENLDREDLSDYEIGKAIRRAEVEFPSRKKMAEAIGIARQDFYRYLAFDALPEYAKEDLETNPRMLGRAAAEDVKQTMARLKDEPGAEEALRAAWDRLKDGTLEQGGLAAAVERGAKTTTEPPASREIRKLFSAGEHAGTVTKDWKALTLRVRNGFLSAEQEQSLVEFLRELLPE